MQLAVVLWVRFQTELFLVFNTNLTLLLLIKQMVIAESYMLLQREDLALEYQLPVPIVAK